MNLWNVWTALATGLFIGCNVGMLLTALLTISSRDETRQPEARKKDDAAASPDSIDSPAEPRAPLHVH